MQRALGAKEMKCNQHDFKLCPLSDLTYNAQYYNVSFCTCKHEKVGRKQTKTVKTTKNITFPIFNADNNYSTPAFILNSEKNFYESEGNKMKVEHQKKMEDYSESKLEINVPKPRTKNNYCSVCKNNYEDYLDHINGQLHRRKINLSAFNKDILDLTNKYQKDDNKRIRNCCMSLGEKTVSVTRIDDDDDQVEIVSNPHKLIKPNEDINHPQSDNLNKSNNYPFVPNYPNNTAQLNQLPFSMNNAMNPAMQMNAFPPPRMNPFSIGNMFRSFSSAYQQQIGQYVLNLNIVLNPCSINPVYPQLSAPFQMSLQANQQLDMLEYTLMNQIAICNRMQNQLMSKFAARAAYIVIEE